VTPSLPNPEAVSSNLAGGIYMLSFYGRFHFLEAAI
jgi:hypothetical protein